MPRERVNQEKYRDLIDNYMYLLEKSSEKSQVKRSQILEDRQAAKQKMPESYTTKMGSHNTKSGNDPDQYLIAKKSKYLCPISVAVNGKVKQDLIAQSIRFETAGNNNTGALISEAYEDIMLKTYTHENTNSEMLRAIDYWLNSGTMITQPMTTMIEEKRILPVKEEGSTKWKEDVVIVGRGLTFQTYDPLEVLLDWRAIPGRVSETSEFAIVTIGKKSPEWIKNQWDLDVEFQQNYDSRGDAVSTTMVMDTYKTQLEGEAGMSNIGGIMVRELYKTDGYCYVFLNDEYLVEVRPNSNGIRGRIPLDITPLFIDPDSPYGMSTHYLLQPTVQVLSTIFNQVADMNSMKVKLPFFAIRGAIQTGTTLNQYKPNEIIEVDVPSQIMMEGGAGGGIDINKLITRLDLQELNQDSMFLYQQALNFVWYVTGLNPSSLGGLQDKQVRVAGVTDIINQSSLRNSSIFVKNFETYFLNPTTKAFANMFEIYYDDFPELKAKGVTRENLKNMRNIRVVNGSYLPADQMEKLQKAQMLLQLSVTNQTLDPVKILTEFMKDLGYRALERFFRDPLELVTQEQAMAIVDLANQQGTETAMQYMQSVAAQPDTEVEQ